MHAKPPPPIANNSIYLSSSLNPYVWRTEVGLSYQTKWRKRENERLTQTTSITLLQAVNSEDLTAGEHYGTAWWRYIKYLCGAVHHTTVRMTGPNAARDRRAAAERIGRGVTLVDSSSDQVWRRLLLDSIAMEGREGRVPSCCTG